MTYPQQPHGAQDPYGRPGPHYGTQQYSGLYGGAPPPKKKTGAIVATVAAVVLVLGGLGITGFVAPGFFLSNGNTTAGGGTTTTPSTTASSTEPDGAGAEDFLQTLVGALDSQDTSTLKDITCPDSASTVDAALDDLSSVSGAVLVDSEEVSDGEAVGTIEVTTASRTGEFEVTITQDDGDWCWQDIASVGADEPSVGPTGEDAPTANGEPVAPQALSAMQGFLDSINAGDAAKAKMQLCPDAISSPANIDELVGYEPNLEIDPAIDGTAAGDRSVQLYLRGTAKGQEVEGYSTNLWVTSYDGPWCVHAFRAVVI